MRMPGATTPGDGVSFDAFLSYSHNDSLTVRKLVNRLQERSVSAWFAEQQIDIGDSIVSKIQEGLGASRFLVVCLSRHFKSSAWCNAELGPHLAKEIRDRTARVLPVKVDDCSDEDIPEFLYDKFTVDIRSEEGFSRLVRKIKASSGRAGPKVHEPGRASERLPAPESEPDLEAAVQLFFPHPISRTYFNIIQQTELSSRLAALRMCVETTVGFLMALTVADLSAHRDLSEMEPLLEDLYEKSLAERIELLFKTLSAGSSSIEPDRQFFPHLNNWALDTERQPSSHFLILMQLALALNAATDMDSIWRAEKLLQRLLSSLAWIRLYRCIEISGVERLRPNLARGKCKTLIGVVKGFLSDTCYWALGPSVACEDGHYMLAPDRSSLLRLSPFLSALPGLRNIWLFTQIHGDHITFVDASGSGERVEASIDGWRLAAGQPGSRIIKIRMLEESAIGDVENPDPAPPAHTVLSGDHDLDEASEPEAEDESAGVPDIDNALHRIERILLTIGSVSSSADRQLVLLDGAGEIFLAALERFPNQAEELQEVAVEWLRYIDEALVARPSDELKRVLWSRRREVEERLEDTLGSFSRSQSLFVQGDRLATESAFAGNESDGLEMEHGFDLLLSRDEIEQSDGIDWFLRKGFQQCVELLDTALDSARRGQVLEVFWRRFARIFLFHGDLFWDLAKYMLKVDPGRWRTSLLRLRRALERDLPVDEAKEIVESFAGPERTVVAAFLAIHPRTTCREIGRSFLEPSDRWEILLAPATHALVIQELVGTCCKDCPPGYLKALFLLLRPRLRNPSSPIALSHSLEIMKSFYELPFFLETIFFRALVTLHKELEVNAEGTPEMDEVCRRFDSYFEAFRKKIQARDQGVVEVRFIPLPVQRKLARDGYFADFFICNARDPIALEAVPHIARRGDIVKFLKNSMINKSALYRLAEDKSVMQDFAARAALCRNPKADPRQIRKFMPQMGVNDFRLIAEDKNVSGYARSFAKELLGVRGG